MRTLSFVLLLAFIFSYNAEAQLTLTDCQAKARANYPLVKQFGLIEQTVHYNISNANKAYLPQIVLSARASYQSDVTQIPESLEQILSQITGREVTFPTLSRDQYQAVAEVSQLVWDGGVVSAQKEMVLAGSAVEKQKLEVDLFALNERINQLFFGAFLLDQQLKQTEILKSELQVNSDRIKACIQNGVANQTDLDVIKVEQLHAAQREAELKSTRNGYLIMLSAFTGIAIDETTSLLKPETDHAVLNQTTINRPELILFNSQLQLYDTQKLLLNAGNRPKIGAFVQGGYGQPGLNMFSDGFSPYYIGGIRFSWSLSGFYSQKNNINKLNIDKNTVGLQRETFLFNTNLKVQQQHEEISKLQTLINNDDEIIHLREKIKNAATAKVENGTLTATDLVREINAENQARNLKSLHEMQLLMAIYNLKNTINN